MAFDHTYFGRCDTCDRPGVRCWEDTGNCVVCDDREDPANDAKKVSAFHNNGV